ncbi:MAG: 2OG-Fe(II) oxygenase [Ketobacter sp.]|nr:MAG: 2OG-Fe(II) oxygenase [Ketobacter sp.]
MTSALQQTEMSTPVELSLAGVDVHQEPFPFLVAGNVLNKKYSALLDEQFPNIRGAGYLPYEPEQCGPLFNDLINTMTSPEFANQLGDLLGIEQMAQYPTYISISKKLNKRHGRIHTDGKSKIATTLLYLNNEWADTSNGCLRFLEKGDDINSNVVPEIRPLFGTLAAFKRTDNSFHGHLPIQGERHVIQIAWLVSDDDKARKAKRGKLSHSIKKVFNLIDQKIGSRKDLS